jgi:hypothetical protein
MDLADWEREGALVADEQGRFLLEGLSRHRRYLARAMRAGFSPGEARFRAEGGCELTIGLGGGGTLWGYCRDDAGRPVPSFSITVARSGNESFETLDDFVLRHARTRSLRFQGPFRFSAEAAGRFEISGLAPGRSRLLVEHEGGLRFEWPPSDIEDGITLLEGERTGPIEIAVPESIRVSGRVINALTGEAIAGARVEAETLGDTGWGPPLAAECDAEGAFSLGPVTETADLVAAASGFATSRVQVRVLLALEHLGSESAISLRPEAELLVRIIDAQGHGAPQEDIIVHVGRSLWKGQTGDDGEVTFRSLPLGGEALVTWTAGDGRLSMQETVLAAGASNVVEFRRWLPGDGPGLFGQVLWRGAGVAEGTAQFRSSEGAQVVLADLGGDGRFQLGPLAPAEGRLTVRVGRFVVDNDHKVSVPVKVMPRGTQVLVELPDGEFEGEVILRKPDGRLCNAAGAEVRLTRKPASFTGDGGREFSMSCRTLADERGRFRIIGLEDGFYVLSCRMCGYREGSTRVRIEEGLSSGAVTVQLEPVEGR